MVVYFHRNPKTYEIFYVGIGNDKRPYQFYKSSRSLLWHRIVSKYGLPIVQIISENLTKIQACEKEIFYIKLLGLMSDGGQLCNFSYGGETSPMSNKEVAKKVHDKLRGRKRPDMLINNPAKKSENREISRKTMIVLRQKSTPENKENQRESARKLFLERNPLKNQLTKWMIFEQKRKRVIQMDILGNELLGHISINDAGRFISGSGSKIYMCCVGKRKSAYGYKWKYAS